MRKSLILLTDLFPTGGIQTYNRYLCGALESEFSGDRVVVISLYDSRKNKRKYWSNITIKYCDLIPIKWVQKILFISKAILTILMGKPQFLICAHIDLSPLALFLKKACCLNYAVLTHGIDVWELKRGIKYYGLTNANIITSVSQYTKERMVGNGVNENKIRLLQDTVDTDSFYPKAVDKNLLHGLRLENKRVLLTVGRISSSERYKGHDTMLRVLGALSGEYVWLVIGYGDDLSRLSRKAKELGVFEKIRFLGEIRNDKLIDYYNLCDVFVMPSKGEGFGIAFLEALACGKPVIGGNMDGSTEPLMNGKLGFLVDPDSVEEIIQAISLAFTRDENRTNSDYLRQEVERNFGVQIFNKKVKEIFGCETVSVKE